MAQPILNHFASATLYGALCGLVGTFVHLLGNALKFRNILHAVKTRPLDPRTLTLLGSLRTEDHKRDKQTTENTFASTGSLFCRKK